MQKRRGSVRWPLFRKCLAIKQKVLQADAIDGLAEWSAMPATGSCIILTEEQQSIVALRH